MPQVSHQAAAPTTGCSMQSSIRALSDKPPTGLEKVPANLPNRIKMLLV